MKLTPVVCFVVVGTSHMANIAWVLVIGLGICINLLATSAPSFANQVQLYCGNGLNMHTVVVDFDSNTVTDIGDTVSATITDFLIKYDGKPRFNGQETVQRHTVISRQSGEERTWFTCDGKPCFPVINVVCTDSPKKAF